MQEKMRGLLLRGGAALGMLVVVLQGALSIHIPALTTVIESNPNGTIAAVIGYFIALHLAKQNS